MNGNYFTDGFMLDNKTLCNTCVVEIEVNWSEMVVQSGIANVMKVMRYYHVLLQ